MNPPREHFSGVGPAAISPESCAWPPSDHRLVARLVAAHDELMCPGHLAACGITDAVLDEPPLSLPEAVAAGWFTAADQREIEGTATEADLTEAGYSPDEVREILAEQQDRACASST